MSDLLERLEEHEEFGVHPAVCDEAIAEIKRLRAALDDILAEVGTSTLAAKIARQARGINI